MAQLFSVRHRSFSQEYSVMLNKKMHFSRALRSTTAFSLCAILALPVQAEAPGRGLTAQFEKDYLIFIINHHFSGLRIGELAAGTDTERDATVNDPQEGTSPTPDTAMTQAKATDEQIRSLARRTNRVQREEIIKAQKFLRDWYGIDHTPQLMPKGQQQIQALEQTPAGKQFDQAFLEVFSAHHYRAMTQSQDCRVKSDIAHIELQQYCEGIVQVQTRQINDMRKQLCNQFNVCDYQPTDDVNGQHSMNGYRQTMRRKLA
jgi:hypothetical protein